MALNEFVDALSLADKAYVMDIYCDREKQEEYPGVSSDTLIKRIKGAEKISVKDADKLLKHDNGVICFMSCTNIYEIENEFERIVKK